MKVLVIGGGGREHALAWKLAQSELVHKVVCCPGNPGMAEIGPCFPSPADLSDYARLAIEQAVDVTVVGPEAPLTNGVVDDFRARDLAIVGPTLAAAQLEGSKIFAKEFLQAANIPTARFRETRTFEEAVRSLDFFAYPVVIKADGLSAGKGVVVAHNRPEAMQAIERLGPALILEEFLQGEEISFIGLCHGRRVLPFAPAQDHKRAYDGDAGPNTGGMGAICDSKLLHSDQQSTIIERIMLPALHRMEILGMPYTGFLYAGLMMTTEGPTVLEFNVRLGDPETQAMLVGLQGDLAETLHAWSQGHSSESIPTWPIPSACVVMAAKNYPDKPTIGDEIFGIEDARFVEGVEVFQAGTQSVDGRIVTSGGRVLGVTASAAALPEAIRRAYLAVGEIRFAGAHYRRDIGHNALKRW